jgi:riboflavin kinase/FMN adenylyltransferase
MEGLVLAIGNFDGVHLGHKKIIQETAKLAKELNLQNNWGVMYFDPHPRVMLSKHKNFLLTNSKEKFSLLKQLGVPNIIEQKFDDIYHLSPEEFFFNVLFQKYNIKGIVTGDNFNFGKGKSGNPQNIVRMATEVGIKYVCVLEEKYSDDISYSSTNIRKFIQDGNIKLVNELLGHNFKISSTVIHGNKLGRTLGFPTANLCIDDYVSPKYGVYIVHTYIDGKKYNAIASFGLRPTVKMSDRKEVLEVHLFNFNEDLYGKIIDVEFLQFVRAELKFDSLDALKEQMELDKKITLDYFKKLES